jgi:phosphomannomutase/phosphoglucomutase
VVRIYAEAAGEERAEELAGEFAAALRAAKAGV